ncbi:hypothetical protein PAXRUDRAFT_821954 [Paxillus rubicundulus Ve08.2h10]|uniref:Unplaced genomic scaffold scaffold_18, whole genome shotgun sequence n=1 Tax=Paxillus rubicundulus Ve08.2h10 TaxID=930991 RepID=A0A0D0ECY1_9AGAM|nr:hypothetical protein PAXRUDRAFT_821954 [Paxillus rubicundulus Ve08.2h10]
MVQITPLLYALSVASQVAPRDTSPNGLVVRQTFDPSSLPAACQAPCEVINTMTNCGSSITCICATAVGTELQQCMSCLASAEPSAASEAQSALDSWNEACGGTFSLSGGSTSGGSTTTGGASGGSSGGTGATTTSASTPTTSSTTTGGSSSTNPLGSGTNTGGAMGLKAAGVTVGIAAAFFGALMVL